MALSFNRLFSHFSLTPLLRLFMDPRKPDLPDLFPNGQSVSPIHDWARRIQAAGKEVENCFVQEIKYCKCTTSQLHEFLLVRVHYNAETTTHTAYLTLDRSPESSLDSLHSSSGELAQAARISSRSVPAYDRVMVSHDGTERCVTDHQGKFDVIATMTLDRSASSSLIAFATLADVVSAHADYRVTRNQCYWFAFSIWGVMSDCATEISEKDKWNLRGKYVGVVLGENDSSSLSDIKTRWMVARNDVSRKTEEREQQRLALEDQVSLLSFVIHLSHHNWDSCVKKAGNKVCNKVCR